ncbi:hypothetical protein BDV95DRAFT_639513 [Massariosphaeria phaeospora]|uniref:Uncharacterized protein n=1 Tax=Massariosphaeria phaeospora TaxID=100035 RepID=A0A7C8M4N3_9PLEO|nr:hypothetical protein BDV95DRAFT_639513 [Massariosphaeria phaeospora]
MAAKKMAGVAGSTKMNAKDAKKAREQAAKLKVKAKREEAARKAKAAQTAVVPNIKDVRMASKSEIDSSAGQDEVQEKAQEVEHESVVEKLTVDTAVGEKAAGVDTSSAPIAAAADEKVTSNKTVVNDADIVSAAKVAAEKSISSSEQASSEKVASSDVNKSFPSSPTSGNVTPKTPVANADKKDDPIPAIVITKPAEDKVWMIDPPSDDIFANMDSCPKEAMARRGRNGLLPNKTRLVYVGPEGDISGSVKRLPKTWVDDSNVGNGDDETEVKNEDFGREICGVGELADSRRSEPGPMIGDSAVAGGGDFKTPELMATLLAAAKANGGRLAPLAVGKKFTTPPTADECRLFNAICGSSLPTVDTFAAAPKVSLTECKALLRNDPAIITVTFGKNDAAAPKASSTERNAFPFNNPAIISATLRKNDTATPKASPTEGRVLLNDPAIISVTATATLDKENDAAAKQIMAMIGIQRVDTPTQTAVAPLMTGLSQVAEADLPIAAGSKLSGFAGEFVPRSSLSAKAANFTPGAMITA